MSSEIQVSQYEEIAIKHNAAFAAFQSIYAAKVPPPEMANIKRDIVSLIIVLALAVVMIASVIVSSSRTIDEFGGGVIGSIAFIMIEGGIMAYAFFRARRNASIKKLENAVRLATIGLGMTFVVGLGANVDASLRHRDIHLPDWVNSSIHVLVALSAPALAFISSDVLAIELMSGDIRRRQNEKEHRELMSQWVDDMNSAWAREKSKWGMRIDMEQPRKALSTNVHEQSEQPRKALSPAVTQTIEWLMINDPENALSVRDAAQKAGVSVGTMGTAKKSYRDGE
jgi:hypothetical protein